METETVKAEAAEEEGKDLFESDICNHCPMQKLV